jgi:hypothetical protein
MIDLRPDHQGKPGLRMFKFVPRPTSWAYRWFVSQKYPPLDAVEVSSSPYWKP